jgi:hypothetical protein
MSQINTELGRTSNTANTQLANGSTPASPSLFWLANQSGSINQTAPHSISEFYSYSAGYTVRVYASTNASLSPPTAVEISYRINGGSWITTTTTISSNPNSPSLIFTFSVAGAGTDDVDYALRNNVGTNLTFGAALSAPAGQTGYCGRASPYQTTNVNSAKDVYLNAQVVSSTLQTC